VKGVCCSFGWAIVFFQHMNNFAHAAVGNGIGDILAVFVGVQNSMGFEEGEVLREGRLANFGYTLGNFADRHGALHQTAKNHQPIFIGKHLQ